MLPILLSESNPQMQAQMTSSTVLSGDVVSSQTLTRAFLLSSNSSIPPSTHGSHSSPGVVGTLFNECVPLAYSVVSCFCFSKKKGLG